MMLKRVHHAVWIALALHGALILIGQYRLSYDAYTHMFFADHYQRGWWSLWEARWYTGFDVRSYPPLTHQLIALLGRPFGVDAGFALLLWAVVAAFPLAVYAFSRAFVSRPSAALAAMLAAFLPSLYLAAHTFGQLPTLLGTLLALFASAALADFLRTGERSKGLLSVALFTTMMAAHHAVLLYAPFPVAAVFFRQLLEKRQNKTVLFYRTAMALAMAGCAALIVVWPFWDWGRGQSIQTPIDHLSRHNFFAHPLAAALFFLPVYGLLIPLLPFVFRTALRKRFWGAGGAFCVLFFLGLGGTTPLPRAFFGPYWAWLTYDRFALWASLTMLPLLGACLAALIRAGRRQRALNGYLIGLAATALLIGLIPTWLPLQPRPLDMQPIVDFLAKDDRARYRYLTFGFGDQFALLSRLAPAATLDGSYHTARALPELRESGVGQIDTAYWLPGGLAALDPILEKAGQRGVRWGFVALDVYAPILQRHGWKPMAALSNGVQVWENPEAILPPPVQPPETSPFAAFSWGTFPLLAFFTAAFLAVRIYWPPVSEKLSATWQAFALGMLPVSLTFWSYRRLFAIEHPRIYFTYTDALFFLSDGIALTMVLVFAIGRRRAPFWPEGSLSTRWRAFFARPAGWLVALCALAMASVVWSLDWRTSLYVSLHGWLCLGLYFAVRDTPAAWRWFAWGCCAALALQTFAGGWQFLAQSTEVTLPLGLEWPGSLTPDLSGASVIQTADGARWLRAYGTMPHPNLLGGFVVVLLAGPLAFFLRPSRRGMLALLLILAAGGLLTLTFSRSAWLGTGLMGAALLARRNALDTRRLAGLGLAGLATAALLVTWLGPLLLPRVGAADAPTEQVSNFTRQWLTARAVELVRQRPVLGAGVGSFSLALSRHVAAFYEIEPVHSLPLLVAAELGAAGLVVAGGLALAVVRDARKAKTPVAIVFSAAALAVLAVSLFDHYFWTLAPGRTLFAALLGVWQGQMRRDDCVG